MAYDTKQRKRLELVAALRMMLWWGAQSLKKAATILENQVQIKQMSKAFKIYPEARWTISKNKVYCLTAYSDEDRITVWELSDISRN